MAGSTRHLGAVLAALCLWAALAGSHQLAEQSNPRRHHHHADRPALEVFMMVWNEAHMLPYAVRFYQARFPAGSVQITVYDNESTDATRQLARRLGCRVRSLATRRALSDRAHTDLNNEAWKASTADWVLVVDVDEWVDVWPHDLAVYETLNVTAVKTKGVYLVWPEDTVDLSAAPRGVWDPPAWDASTRIPRVDLYDKPALFYRAAVTELGISPGGHEAAPRGRVKWLAETRTPPPRLYHARYFDVATTLARSNAYMARMSEDNKVHGWGGHYTDVSLELIARQFDYLRRVAKPLPWRVL